MTNFSVDSVDVLNNPAPFQDSLSFCVEFTCDTNLQHNVVWKVLYLNQYEEDDQELHTESMTVSEGTCTLTLRSPPPDLARIPTPDVIGSCIFKVTCTYEDIEFYGMGYFCSVYFTDNPLTSETIKTDDTRPDVSTLSRNIMSEQPRPVHAPCHFDSPPPDPDLAEANAEVDVNADEEEASEHSSLMDEEDAEEEEEEKEEDEDDEGSDVEI